MIGRWLSSLFLFGFASAFQQPDPRAEPAAAERIGAVPYVRLETRQATREALLAELVPELGSWGDMWVVLPFPYAGWRAGADGLAAAHGPEDELAALAAQGPGSDLGRVFTDKHGRETAWRNVGALANRPVLFDQMAPGEENATAYIYCAVTSERARDVVLTMGSDDGLKLWINGRERLSKDVPRSLDPHEDRVAVRLEPGVNHVLAKIAQGAGNWSFQVNTRQELTSREDALLEYYLDRDFPAGAESADYLALTVPAPEGVVLEVGGLDVLPDGRPIACTRRGEVWIIDGAYDLPPVDATFTRFASGLHEPLGLELRDEDGRTAVYCVQRSELTRLVDSDGDGRADRYETVCDSWGISGNYHEFAFGPKFDADGNAWVTLNLGFCGSLGKATVPWRGWACKVTPQGELIPVCDGLRSPNGIGRWTDDEMFYVDNQGDYVATCRVTHLAQGSWAGHPASLRWRAEAGLDPEPEALPAAVWLPYGRMGQSAADLVLDDTGGKFGPFAGQFFTGDQTNATVMRVTLERVEGLYQGACYPFIEGLDSGVNRLAFAPDGSLFAGQTDRGWGSVGRKRHGLQRIVWRGSTPFAIREVRAHANGFDVELTRPFHAGDAGALAPAAWRMASHEYAYHADYGAPEEDPREHALCGVLALDERTVRLIVAEESGLRTGAVYEIAPGEGVRAADEGARLTHGSVFYTLQARPAPDQGPRECP